MEHFLIVMAKKDADVSVIKVGSEDYIGLTDMSRAKDGEFFFSSWLRNRNAIEFLGVWEKLNNFRLSAKEWMEILNRNCSV